MSLTVVALAIVLLITGVTSLVSHPLTLLGSAAVALALTLIGVIHPNGRLSPGFLVAALGLCVLCLLSSESNISSVSSTVHILACYATVAGLAVYVPDYSDLCRRVCLLTYAVLIVWVLAQTIQVGTIASWTVNGAAASGNQMAAQLNMTLPLVMLLAFESQGTRKLAMYGAVMLGMLAIICVGSRNGIGTLLITLVLVGLFRHMKSAIAISSLIMSLLMLSSDLMRLPIVVAVLGRFRFIGYRSNAPRSLIWTVCMEYIQKSPWLGIGPGKSDEVLAVMDINHAHNNFVQVAMESGLVAAVVFLLTFVALLQLPLRAALVNRRAFMLSLPVIGYWSQTMTDTPIHHPQQTLLLVICVFEARRMLYDSTRDEPGFQTQTQYSAAVSAIGRPRSALQFKC